MARVASGDTDSPRVIALDVGGSSVKSGLVTPEGALDGPVTTTPLASCAPAEALLEELAGVLRRHLEGRGPGGCLGVGVAFPGPFDYPAGRCLVRGVGGKFEALHGLDLGAALRARAGLGATPLVFRNDAQAAVVGEARRGAGVGVARLVGVTLGTGMGAAFLVGGDPVAGIDGVPEDGELYHQEFRGRRADDVFGVRGLRARLAGAGLGRDVPVAAARALGEPAARGSFEAFGSDLGDFLAPFLERFRAERLLVLGGVAASLPLWRGALQARVPCRVGEGALGPAAALHGAAALVLDPLGLL